MHGSSTRQPSIEYFGTLGPACASPAVLAEMLLEGMTGVRLNLSHGSLRESGALIDSFHEAARSVKDRLPFAPELLIDLQGPELRTGTLQKPLALEKGSRVVLVPQNDARDGGESVSGVPEKADGRGGDSGRARKRSGACTEEAEKDGLSVIPVPEGVFTILEAGDTLLFDDGCLTVRVDTVRKENRPPQGAPDGTGEVPTAGTPALSAFYETGTAFAAGSAMSRHLLTSHKSLKIVGKELRAPALTATDVENIRAAKAYGVTAVMQPFVRGAEDLRFVRQALDEAGAGQLRLFAKIENRIGLSRLEEIITALFCGECKADAFPALTEENTVGKDRLQGSGTAVQNGGSHRNMLVIARGDLGNDMPLWELPSAQKKIAAVCRENKVPFLVVTQMLASMTQQPVPTRAEVTDIYNAVLDGASALMVTGETAVGRYPAEVIRYLKRTAEQALSDSSGSAKDAETA